MTVENLGFWVTVQYSQISWYHWEGVMTNFHFHLSNKSGLGKSALLPQPLFSPLLVFATLASESSRNGSTIFQFQFSAWMSLRGRE